MIAIVLGVSVGLFMAAFVNWKYNSYKWIKTSYLLWMGGAALIAAVGMVFFI